MAFDEQSCPLCLAIKAEKPIYADDYITIMETKNLKGHKRRIMVCWNIHNDYHYSSKNQDYMLNKLEEIGKQVFDYTYKFVIMTTKFAAIRDHFHLVACAIDPNTDDFWQVQGTPWIKVIDVKDWVKPEESVDIVDLEKALE